MKSPFAALLSSVAIAVMFAAPAGAQPANHNASGMREACAADQQTLCADVKPGMPMMQCMQRNAGKVSDGCKAAMAAMRGQGMAGAQGANPAAGGAGSGGKKPN